MKNDDGSLAVFSLFLAVEVELAVSTWCDPSENARITSLIWLPLAENEKKCAIKRN